MVVEKNLDVVKNFLSALRSQEKATLLSLINEGFRWQVMAPSIDADPQVGAFAIDSLMELLGGLFEPNATTMDVTRTVCEGDDVVVEMHVTATTKSGKPYDNWYVNWFKVRDGKISLWHEHTDTKQAENMLGPF